MSYLADDKKTKEQKILQEALAKARKRGGESRRLVDGILGTIEQTERPDFLIHVRHWGKRPTALGIEHFRVDYLSELNRKRGKQNSLVVPLQREVCKLITGHNFPDELGRLSRD